MFSKLFNGFLNFALSLDPLVAINFFKKCLEFMQRAMLKFRAAGFIGMLPSFASANYCKPGEQPSVSQPFWLKKSGKFSPNIVETLFYSLYLKYRGQLFERWIALSVG